MLATTQYILNPCSGKQLMRVLALPFPISDIKKQSNIDRLTGVYHKITNLSLENGTFPKTEKKLV